MKIIALHSQNFKKLKAIDITPKDHTVIVSGKNGQGKSSILDSILVALAGKQKDLIKPIREGESKSTVVVELDDFIVTRTFKQGSASTLEVIQKKTGEVQKSPQAVLDTLIGSLAFDPLEFSDKKSSEQRELLLKLSGLNFTELNINRKNFYDHRHETGVLMNSLAEYTNEEIAEAKRIIEYGRVDSQKILLDIDEAQKHENHNNKKHEFIRFTESKIVDVKAELKMIEEKLNRLQDELQQQKLIPEMPTINVIDLRSQLQSAEAHNSSVNHSVSVLDEYIKRLELQNEYDQYGLKIEEIDRSKEVMLEQAKMPIHGLSVDDDGVVYNKIPFSQLSSAEKLKVSMSIAMAMNPELRVIRIMDGSLLDDDNMKVISEMAKDEDFQIWVEKVDSTGKIGFYIEDGSITNINE